MRAGKIFAVNDIETSLLESNRPALLVSSNGRVVSSGWCGPELAQYFYLTPPTDGIQEFDFIATRPPAGGVVLPSLAPVRAEFLLLDVDLENYWGAGQRLRGVRVYAVSNSKTALFTESAEMPGPVGRTAAHVAPSRSIEETVQPSFAGDIKPLFRSRDINIMASIGGWRLDVYEDVRANAEAILHRLRDGDMPCDGAWPVTDVDLFQRWFDADMPA